MLCCCVLCVVIRLVCCRAVWCGMRDEVELPSLTSMVISSSCDGECGGGGGCD